MKYVVRFVIGAFIGCLIGVGLNIALSYGFWEDFWPDLRQWTVVDFLSRWDELGGWGWLAFILPTAAGALGAIEGIGRGILDSIGAAFVIVFVAFVVGIFIVIGWGGVLALLLLFGLLGEPVYDVIFIIFE